jgi:hypothetical protein
MQLERVFIMITQHEYTHKPSMATLRAALRRAMDQGSDSVQLTWGENEITVERTQYGWIGYGWIGRSGGDDNSCMPPAGGMQLERVFYYVEPVQKQFVR